MRNYERAAERRAERTRLRHAYLGAAFSVSSPLYEIIAGAVPRPTTQELTDQALDVEMLLGMVSHGTNSRCNVLRNRIVMRYLRETLAVPVDEIAAAFNERGDGLERALSAPLLAPPEISAAIEAYLDERYPETPEPGRVIAPTGERAIPGERYPLAEVPGGAGAS